MALFKKKEDSQQSMPPDMGQPDQYGQDYSQGYDQNYGQYPQDPQQGYQQDYSQGQYPPGQGPPGQGQYPSMAPSSSDTSKETIQEIAEAIVEEKWKEKKKEIDKIIDWKEETATKITQLQQQFTDLKSSFDNLHKGMLGKITEYDENLTNVGTEIKAMEKVFSKVLPSLTDSVNRMQRMTTPVRKK